MIRIQKQDGGEQAQQKAVEKVKASLPPDIEYRRTEFVGPKVSDELFRDGVLAVIFAIIGILAYIWFRFEWQFGLGAIIALTKTASTRNMMINTRGPMTLTSRSLATFVS